MADNINVTPGTGKTIAADEISDVLYQRVKIAHGADGSATDTSAAAPLPVTAVITAGTVTSITNAVSVTGPLTDGEMRASAVPVSAASLPLPTGAATSAKQDTAIGHLSTIAGVAGNGLTDTELRASAVPVEDANSDALLAAAQAIQTAAEILDNTVSGSETQVDVVGALPAGTNTIGATRDAGPAWTSAFGVSSARVTSADATGIVAVTDAPTSGQRIFVTDIVVSVGATAMLVDFLIETTGTVLLSLYMAANSTVQITPRSALRVATADKKLMIDTSAAGNIAVTCWYYSSAA